MRDGRDIGRKHLPHDPPPEFVPNPEYEVYFITVCCEPRGQNQLATPAMWQVIEQTVEHREQAGDWKMKLMLCMPDHWHALVGFTGTKSMRQVIASFKGWLKRTHGVQWQSGFFDHRLRSWESAEEKRAYILNNPVRAGLAEKASDWPYLLDRR